MAAELPTTSCQRGTGLPSRTSRVPRSSAPALALAGGRIGKDRSAGGNRKLNSWEARKRSLVLRSVPSPIPDRSRISGR